MEFLKKHYEKILLSVVLTGLAAVAVILSLYIRDVQEGLDGIAKEVINLSPQPLQPVDTKKYTNAVFVVQNPPQAELQISNHVFGPVRWVRTPPPEEVLVAERTNSIIGVKALKVTKQAPLYTQVEVVNIAGEATPYRYQLAIERQADPVPANRGRRQENISKTLKGRIFTYKEEHGTGDNAEVVVEVPGEPDLITVGKSKPYKRVAGYELDAFYPVENGRYPRLREGSKLIVSGITYIIIAIREAEIILQDENSGKRYTVPYKL
jgi:hypothetical protein